METVLNFSLGGPLWGKFGAICSCNIGHQGLYKNNGLLVWVGLLGPGVLLWFYHKPGGAVLSNGRRASWKGGGPYSSQRWAFTGDF